MPKFLRQKNDGVGSRFEINRSHDRLANLFWKLPNTAQKRLDPTMMRGLQNDPPDDNIGVCDYDVIINGRTIVGDGTECFQAPSDTKARGVLAFLEAAHTEPIVLWDPDAPCGTYIHFASIGRDKGLNVEPMTAGAGAKIHTYHAAVFSELPSSLPEGTVGCMDKNMNMNWENLHPQCELTWKVARFDASCPDPSRTIQLMSGFLLGLFMVLLYLAWKNSERLGVLIANLWKPKVKPRQQPSYIALSTFNTGNPGFGEEANGDDD